MANAIRGFFGALPSRRSKIRAATYINNNTGWDCHNGFMKPKLELRSNSRGGT